MNFKKISDHDLQIITSQNEPKYYFLFTQAQIKFDQLFQTNYFSNQQLQTSEIILEEYGFSEYLNNIICPSYLNTIVYIEKNYNHHSQQLALTIFDSLNQKLNEIININFQQLDLSFNSVVDQTNFLTTINHDKLAIFLEFINFVQNSIKKIIVLTIQTMEKIFYNLNPQELLINFLEEEIDQFILLVQTRCLNLTKKTLTKIYQKYKLNPDVSILKSQTKVHEIPFQTLTDEHLFLSDLSIDQVSALKILGLANDATKKEIKTKYKMLAKQYHPDINKGDDNKFKIIQKAWEILK